MADLEVRTRAPNSPRPEPGLTGLGRRATEQFRPASRAAVRPLGIYLASRAAVALAVGTVLMLQLGLVKNDFHSTVWATIPPGAPFFRAFGIWDASWYLQIAGHGYDTALHPMTANTPTVAFLPLLPLVIRAVAFVTGLNVLYAGVLANFVIGALASVGLWMLVRRITDVPTADRATALWCFFPGAMTLSLVYAEGLVVLLATVCLMALMRRRWLLAGLAAALAGATAPEGLALVACCAWAAGAALWPRPAETGGLLAHINRDRWPALVAPALAPLGWLAYQGYLWHRTGTLTAWWQVERRWFRGGFEPWQATGDKVRMALSHPGIPDNLVPAVGVVVLVVAAVLLWWWKPPAIVTIYAAVGMALVLSSGVVGARPRFFIALFPFVVALARPVRGPAFQALLGLSALCLGLLTLILVGSINHTLQFTP